MLSGEDKKDVARAMGPKAAAKVSTATNDSKNKAIHAKMEGKKAKPKNKCEHCGGAHSNHASYVYRTGNL